MKNNKIKGISPALIWENLKLGWYVPVIASILFFFSGIFQIITHYSQLDQEAYYIHSSLLNQNIFFLLLMIAVSLVSAMLIMGYMHNPTKSLAFHSQPYTKAKLYSSHVISGYIMCLIPLLVTAVLYFVFMKDAYLYDTSNVQTNVYTAGNILRWLVNSISMTTFSYGLFVLAGSLSGNTFMHLALSGVFFCIVPVIILTVNFYCDTFISGFVNLPDSVMNFMVKSNPFIRTATLSYKEATDIEINGLWYLLAGIVFILLGFAACKKAKLEKVGDSFIFKAVEEVMTYLVVFVGMTIFASLLTIKNSRAFFMVGLITGALICFFTAKIIIARTARVFNRKNLVSLLVYTLISGSFIAFTVFDVAGLSDKVPSPSDIQSVYSEFFLSNIRSDISVHKVNTADINSTDEYMIDDDEYLELLTELHKTICKNDLDVDAYGMDDENTDLPYQNISFDYKLKNGNDFHRVYGIRVDEKLADILDKLSANEQFRKMNMYEDKIDWNLDIYICCSTIKTAQMKSL